MSKREASCTVGRGSDATSGGDLKGINVILGCFGEVFLVDWGLAKSGADEGAAAPDTRARFEPASSAV